MTPPRSKKRRRRKILSPGGRNPAIAEAKRANLEESAAPSRGPERLAPSVVVSLEPLAPIVVRSGRPLEGKSDADPARFPPPSTVAGCLRTAWARATGQPFGPTLAQIAVTGPLLLDRDNRILAPKPADALYFGHGGSARCARAEPCAFEAGCGADLPNGLLPVRLTEPVPEKPGDGPAWWSWSDLLDFRSGGNDCACSAMRERLVAAARRPPHPCGHRPEDRCRRCWAAFPDRRPGPRRTA